VRPEELLWLIHEQSVFFIQALKNLSHIFSKQKKVGEEKNWSLFSIFRLVRVSDFLVQNFLVYQFITKKIIYNFSTICTVNVTNPPSLAALKSELWREPLLRQCFSIGT